MASEQSTRATWRSLIPHYIQTTIFPVLLLCISYGCINQIEVFRRSDPALVIDGVITNEPGPQRVKILYTTAYNTRPDYQAIEKAVVKVTDNLGNEEYFTYDQYGSFQSSSNFSGVVGRSYKINITLESGRQYESLFDRMLPVSAVEAFSYKQNNDRLDFHITFQDEGSRKDYYRWRYKNTYAVVAPMSGRICYATDFDYEYLFIESDFLFDGKRREHVKAFSIPLDRKFNHGYYALIKQMSSTKEAHDFWIAIRNQLNNNGTIFETANFQVRGNVYSMTDRDELVLGYFGASAVETRAIFVWDYVGRFEEICCDYTCYPNGNPSERCHNCSANAGLPTNEKPDFWP